MTNKTGRSRGASIGAWAVLCVLVALVVGCGTDADQPESSDTQDSLDTIEGIAHFAFNALKTNDALALEAANPTRQDYEWLMERAREALSADEFKRMEEGLEKQGGIEGMMQVVQEQNGMMFLNGRRKSSEAFDWDDARFVGLDMEKTWEREKLGTQEAAIYFLVHASGKQWRFLLDGCVKTERGWFLGDGLRFLGEYEREGD